MIGAAGKSCKEIGKTTCWIPTLTAGCITTEIESLTTGRVDAGIAPMKRGLKVRPCLLLPKLPETAIGWQFLVYLHFLAGKIWFYDENRVMPNCWILAAQR